jgi:hypothetical protein
MLYANSASRWSTGNCLPARRRYSVRRAALNECTCRWSRRGNRRVNYAIHMAAITQIRQPHSEGRAYYNKKLAEGKTHREALRSLKRQISDAVFTRLRADARRAAAQVRDPGGK